MESWLTLKDSLPHILQIKKILEPLKRMALLVNEFNLEELNHDLFKIKLSNTIYKASQTLCKYELKYYSIILSLHKLKIPVEIYPRQEDLFKIKLRIKKKKIENGNNN
jgi:hypothetical protein